MLPNAHDLRSFVEISKAENLSRAAERLGTSQPALTQAVKRLETSMGQSLLVRSKSGVKLTRAGQRLVRESRELLAKWEQLVSETARDENEIRGRYTLGIHPSVALYTLDHFLPELLQAYSELQIDLVHDLSRKITESVISFQVDFGIVVNPAQHPDLVILELFKDEVRFFTSKKKTPMNDPQSNEKVLILEPSLNQAQDVYNKSQKKGLNFKRSLSSSNLEVIARLTSNGAGLGILPSRVAKKEDPTLMPLENSPVFKDSICLVYRHDFLKSEAARTMTKWIAERLKGMK
ncbi:MAG: LysR family transcriptional regulator [Deltaproteobacteria bacterium]|nr:MAG: LysR family transcriptional regulator [Deltaproteobacteria bacterium]TNF31067.1 MAG: LysR family transcriptional regulator [Deltaproteobacteria bacterium]